MSGPGVPSRAWPIATLPTSPGSRRRPEPRPGVAGWRRPGRRGALLGAGGRRSGGGAGPEPEDARRQREATLAEQGPGRRAARRARRPGGRPARAALERPRRGAGLPGRRGRRRRPRAGDAPRPGRGPPPGGGRDGGPGGRSCGAGPARRCVNAYIGASGGRRTDLAAGSADVNEVVQRQQLLDVVEGNLDADLDQLRALVEDQRRAEAGGGGGGGGRRPAGRRAAGRPGGAGRASGRPQARLTEALRDPIADWQAKAAELDPRRAAAGRGHPAAPVRRRPPRRPPRPRASPRADAERRTRAAAAPHASASARPRRRASSSPPTAITSPLRLPAPSGAGHRRASMPASTSGPATARTCGPPRPAWSSSPAGTAATGTA